MTAPLTRRPPIAGSLSTVRSDRSSTKRLLAQGERWRLIDEGNQWVLEVRKGRQTRKSAGWRAMRFHVEKAALCRSIRELCGPDHKRLELAVRDLPDYYRRTTS